MELSTIPKLTQGMVQASVAWHMAEAQELLSAQPHSRALHHTAILVILIVLFRILFFICMRHSTLIDGKHNLLPHQDQCNNQATIDLYDISCIYDGKRCVPLIVLEKTMGHKLRQTR